MTTTRRLAAILAADIAGYSRLMAADDEATVRELKALQAMILPMIGQLGGRIVDTAGDGILAEFGSVVEAVNCAIAAQQAIVARNADAAPGRAIRLRMGVNFGDVVADEVRLYGDGINIASRLQALAEPDGVCVSGKVHEEIQDKIGVAFEDCGEHPLKNITRPVRVWRWTARGAGLPIAEGLPTPVGPLTLPEKPSIAVLPFENMSGDPDQDYFADGICEDLITALSSLRWFFVIARNSTFTYKRKSVDVKRVAAELGVYYVVEGSVRKVADRVRINVQLIDGRTGGHVWAERYDRNLTDVFQVQDEIVQSVSSCIEPQLLEFEARRAESLPARDLDAWDLVMRARAHYWRMTPTATGIGVDLLRDAIARYPGYGPAHSMFAFALLFSRHMGWSASEGVVDVATASARRAAAIDELDPWAHVSLGYLAVVARDTDRAVAAFDRAVELNPNFAAAIGWRGLARAFGSRSDEAIRDIDRSIRLSPRDPQNAIFVSAKGIAHYLVGRYTEAVQCSVQSIQMKPDFVAGLRLYCAALAQAQRVDEAQAVLARIRQLQPNLSARLLRETVPYARAEAMDHFLAGLRIAGIDEA
jgi:adenylate cyclase